ncbi:MAG: NAD(P)H-quinone oxidoreductase [Pseudomonadales bacterium]
MKAIVVNESQELIWTETEIGQPGPNEILIDVRASAVNRADLMQRRGLYPPPQGASQIMGLECAGIVLSVGSAVSRHTPGDSVCALLAGGGYAEQVLVDEGSAISIPEGIDYESAAALPEVFATAWLNLFIEAGLQPGERVVLHAGASGVGTAGIQLCRAFGAECFVTAGGSNKIRACLDLGAAGGHDRRSGSFLAGLNALWPDGADVILDPVGGQYLSDNLDALRMNGRLVLIGLMGGAASEINLAKLMMKRLKVVGSTLRTRSLSEKTSVMAELEQYVWPKISQGEIKPIIHEIFPMDRAEEAQALVASDVTIGKVILKV